MGMMIYLRFTPRTRVFGLDQISFYPVNQYGRIKAVEATYFEGDFNSTELDLHFEGPLPSPPVTPDLPRVGDPMIPQLPKIALGAGGLLLVTGLSMMMIRDRLPARGTQ
jgi:hypothetical protein